MQISWEKRKEAFVKLGHWLETIMVEMNPSNEFGLPGIMQMIKRGEAVNPWFTVENQLFALQGVRAMLDSHDLEIWTSRYLPSIENGKLAKRVGVIMAGNIPLVGFHDFLTVLMAGHIFVGKLSSKDSLLLPWLARQLCIIEPGFIEMIHFEDGLLKNYASVIATGNNNSFHYFDHYFRNYPKILRKNRNSVAVLTGEESEEDLLGLADDIFLYFGLGCRNVSSIFVPEGYDPGGLFPFFDRYRKVIQHNKYKNNFDYYKSLMLLNADKFIDNGFIMMKPLGNEYASPVAVVNYGEYVNAGDLNDRLERDRDQIQCIVGRRETHTEAVHFGKSQFPHVWDYADGVDVMKFLLRLE